jgi:hypothetical protein
MPLETSNNIAGLVATWPLSGDFVSEGDNHLNLIKSVLKQQFPGANGQGFDTPITATETEINYLGGARANIQAQIDNLSGGEPGEPGTGSEFDPGTRMIFFQSSAPNGWTQVTSNNDAMLRIVSGAGGGSGGSASPISHAHTTAGNTLQMFNLPAEMGQYINLSITTGGGGSDGIDHTSSNHVAGGTSESTVSSNPVSIPSSQGAAHFHGDTGTIDFKYINVITASKD